MLPATYRKPLLYALMILLGLFAGLSDQLWLRDTGLFMAELFIRIFKCISLPIIALSLIVTVANYQSEGMMRSVAQRTLLYTLATTLIAASLSALLYLAIRPALVTTSGRFSTKGIEQGSYLEHLMHLVPENLFSPFLEQQVFSALFLSLLIGAAIRAIPDSSARSTVNHFFRGLHGLLIVITRWVIELIPLGLFGFITSTIVQLRSGTAIRGIGEYLAVILLANLVQGLLVLPLLLKFKGIRPFKSLRGMLPALSLAFFSKSSVGTLPVTMDTIEKNLKVKPEVSRFILPLCTSINMNGCAAFIFVTVVYLMQNAGIELSLAKLGLWVLVASLAAIGNAGVPMGCFFLSTSLLASMNVPIHLMGIILPFYTLIDMLETALNVWSDVTVTLIVDKGLEE